MAMPLFRALILPLILATPPLDSGRDLLVAMDNYMRQIHDETADWELRIDDGAAGSRTYALRWMMRAGQSMLTVRSPADMRGITVLNLAHARTYVINPMTWRMRRGASTPFAPLFGSSFTYADFVHAPFEPYFNAVVTPGSDDSATVVATAKAGLRMPYARIDIDFHPQTLWVSKVRYYGAKDQLLRTETRESPVCDQELCIAAIRRMVDHRRADLFSEVRVSEFKVNTGLTSRQFSINAVKHAY